MFPCFWIKLFISIFWVMVLFVFRRSIVVTSSSGAFQLNLSLTPFAILDFLLIQKFRHYVLYAFLSIVLIAALESLSRTHLFSDSNQNLFWCKLGRNLLLFLLFACETRFPTMGFLPVI